MSACVAHVPVSAEGGSPATRDGVENGSLLGGDSVRACESLTVSANDIRKLEGRSVRAPHAW
jgi:hypothetical protein